MHWIERFGAGVLLAVAVTSSFVAPADAVNPDISVIGDTRAVWSEGSDRVELFFEEAEIAFVGPVNPYASAEVFVGIHGTDSFEIEEAKLILDRYLPWNLGLTIGHFLLDFGQLNTLHSHAYPFAERPLMHAEFFGEDGIVDTGARLDWLAPAEGVTLRASLGAVRGELFAGGEGHAHDGELAETSEPDVGGSGRIDLFAEPSDDVSFLVGGSILFGHHDPAENAQATWFGVDAKLRWETGAQSAFILNAEGVFGSLDGTDEQAASDPNGFFASADFRASKRWNLGGFAESTTERADDAHRTNRFGGFVGLALMEESTLFRLVGRVTDPDEADSEAEVILQTLFGLGPHRPHRF